MTLQTKRRESTIEAKFIKCCRRYGGRSVKVGHSGLPDQAVLWPSGVTTWAELKALGEDPEPHQQEEIDKMRAMGHTVHVVHNEAEMALFISASLKRVLQE